MTHTDLSLQVTNLLEVEVQQDYYLARPQSLKVRRAKAKAYRASFGITETFIEEVGNRREPLAHRDQSRRGQVSCTDDQYPASYSMLFLDGKFPPQVGKTIHTDIQ